MWKNMVQPGWHCPCALHAGYLRLQTHLEYVIRIAFFTATMVARTCLSVTSYVHCLSCWVYFQLSRSKQVAVAILLAVCPIHKQTERKMTRNFLKLFAWKWRVCSANTFGVHILPEQLRNRCVGSFHALVRYSGVTGNVHRLFARRNRQGATRCLPTAVHS